MTWVKMCGITTESDACGALDAGADALGLVLTESKRRIEPGRARAVVQRVRRENAPSSSRVGPMRKIEFVGVFTTEPLDGILAIGRAIGLDVIQLHTPRRDGDAGRLRDAGFRVLQGIRVRDAASLRPFMHAPHPADAVLLDAWSTAGMGGTGERFDWDALGDGVENGALFPDRGRMDADDGKPVAAGRCPDPLEGLRPVVMAGGLRSDNVREALQRLGPEGVDVSSGVEEAPGKKCAEAMRRFVAEVRAYDGNSDRVSSGRPA